MLTHMFVSSNLHRIRDFIKHVYVDRKYTGDKSSDKLPRLRLVISPLLYMHSHGSYIYFKFSFLSCGTLVQQCSAYDIYTGQLNNFGHQFRCDGN